MVGIGNKFQELNSAVGSVKTHEGRTIKRMNDNLNPTIFSILGWKAVTAAVELPSGECNQFVLDLCQSRQK